MNVINRVLSKLHILSSGKLEISLLHSKDDVILNSLANVFEAVILNKYSFEEKRWIDKIETLRKDLDTSSIKISITDYGAGSPDMNLTAEEMYKGRVVVKTIGEICRSVSNPYKWDFLLFKLIRKFQPAVCIEMGTALGISAAYETAACEINRKGRVVSLEGAESLVSLSKENFKKLSLERVNVVSGRFQDTLQNVLKENAPIDFVFIDGHHDENATLTYYKQILSHLSDNAILVFDDISWSNGMSRAWNIITNDVNLKVSVDLFNVGICIFTKSGAKERKYYKIAI